MPLESSSIATSTDGDPVNCVIVEDQTMFLELLASMISLRGGIRIAGRARDVAEGRAACRKHHPDVLILDLALPDGEGLDVALEFVAANPAGRVIVVSGQASDFICPAWLNDNLQAVISKNDAFDSLRCELDELVGVTSPRPEPGVSAMLTDREAEVFRLIGDGLSTREIAARLTLSEHTIHTHRKRLAVKLGTSGDELTRRAVAHRATFFADKND